MSDDIDRAQEREEEFRRIALEEQARKRGQNLPPCGECYGCGEPFPPKDNRLFCNGACADDYEAERKQRANQGGNE